MTLKTSVESSIYRSVPFSRSVSDSVHLSVRNPVWDSVNGSVWSPIYSSVTNSVSRSVLFSTYTHINNLIKSYAV